METPAITDENQDAECSICGLELKEACVHKLPCNHTFHYECLQKSFLSMKKTSYSAYTNSCPYCRIKCGYLPIVNGLKKVHYDIHISKKEELPIILCVPCKFVLTRGKNKGSECNKKCFLGYEYCKVHKKAMKL